MSYLRRVRYPTALVFLIILASACTSLKQYRANPKAAIFADRDCGIFLQSAACPIRQEEIDPKLPTYGKSDCDPESEPDACPMVRIEPYLNYSLSTVEFDDQGLPFSAEQEQSALEQVSSVEGNDAHRRGRMVVVLVHGWMHNAAPEDKNLDFLQEILRDLAMDEKISATANARPQRRVCGVFVAWRGKSISVPGLSLLSFWNRKETAHTVGDRGLSNLLVSLSDAVRLAPASSPDEPNRFIVLGHSFGGAAVFSATASFLSRDLIEGRDFAGPQRPPLMDAAVLINPAFEAGRLTNLLDAARDSRRIPADASSIPRRPLLTIMTSKSDRATSVAFPLARIFGTALSGYLTLENPIKSEKLSERIANLKSVGHFEPFITHEMRAPSKDGNQSECDAFRMLPYPAGMPTDASPAAQVANSKYRDERASDIMESYRHGKTMYVGGSCLIPRKDLHSAQSAVFNVEMDEEIWDGHGLDQGKVRQCQFVGFLTNYLEFLVEPETFFVNNPPPVVRDIPFFLPRPCTA